MLSRSSPSSSLSSFSSSLSLRIQYSYPFTIDCCCHVNKGQYITYICPYTSVIYLYHSMCNHYYTIPVVHHECHTIPLCLPRIPNHINNGNNGNNGRTIFETFHHHNYYFLYNQRDHIQYMLTPDFRNVWLNNKSLFHDQFRYILPVPKPSSLSSSLRVTSACNIDDKISMIVHQKHTGTTFLAMGTQTSEKLQCDTIPLPIEQPMNIFSDPQSNTWVVTHYANKKFSLYDLTFRHEMSQFSLPHHFQHQRIKQVIKDPFHEYSFLVTTNQCLSTHYGNHRSILVPKIHNMYFVDTRKPNKWIQHKNNMELWNSMEYIMYHPIQPNMVLSRFRHRIQLSQLFY